ncbi:thiol-disulfide oxidoreductase DCC family protein [Neorhodopirellula lusitana]|uniref:thiol-disulfide oxidoreductase DCC family protein n=1 Tax=Neorhodopirellula lusitana TaxID=445327 RepID=UPI0024B73FFB|nr:DUF393 domain-containing protein [Neorhodopirellula lusitana]
MRGCFLPILIRLGYPVLPDPDTYPDRDVVIYDGQCSFCASGVKRLHQLDRFGKRLAFLSLHDERTAERYPDLTHEMLMQEMFVVDSEGNRHGGADAVRYFSRRLPLLWIAAPILHVPGTASLWRHLYRFVGRNRYWISQKFFGGKPDCDGDSCSIHLRR